MEVIKEAVINNFKEFLIFDGTIDDKENYIEYESYYIGIKERFGSPFIAKKIEGQELLEYSSLEAK